MVEKIIKKNINTENTFSIYTSLSKFNYDEENQMYLSFHTTKSVSTILKEKELDILIKELQQAKKTLHESNKNKNRKV